MCDNVSPIIFINRLNIYKFFCVKFFSITTVAVYSRGVLSPVQKITAKPLSGEGTFAPRVLSARTFLSLRLLPAAKAGGKTMKHKADAGRTRLFLVLSKSRDSVCPATVPTIYATPIPGHKIQRLHLATYAIHSALARAICGICRRLQFETRGTAALKASRVPFGAGMSFPTSKTDSRKAFLSHHPARKSCRG